MTDRERNPWDDEVDRLRERLDELDRERLATLDAIVDARERAALYPDAPTAY